MYGRFRYLLPDIVLVLLLTACERTVYYCGDPTALNCYYNTMNYKNYVLNNSTCKYGPTSQFVGNWTYTDTFTWYPPQGGTPRTSYTKNYVTIGFGGIGSQLYLSGFSGDFESYTGTLEGDSIITPQKLFVISPASQTISFPDGLTNSAVGYMRKE